MGSFGKNRIFRSPPVGDFHGERRGDRLAAAHPLHAFKLGHRPVDLPLQIRLVAQDFVEHFPGRQYCRRLSNSISA